jgi:CDP-3, 6-dideoxy-D-glycero-L-glycero-4-hexulose-4-reductase
MNVLISGATGFLGRSLIKKLPKRFKIIIFTTGKSKSDPLKIFSLKKVILTNIKNFKIIIEKYKPEIFINLQVKFTYNHDSKTLKEMIKANINQPLELLQICAENGLKRLISPTSFAVFDKNKNYKPANLFAGTKQAFSCLAEAMAIKFKLYFDEVIVYDTFGSEDKRKKILNLFADTINKKNILPMSPGKQIIDISHIDTVAGGFVDLIKKKTKRKNFKKLFYASSGNRFTLIKLKKKISEIIKKKINVKFGELNYRQNEIMIPVKLNNRNNILKKEKIDIHLKNFFLTNS